MATIFGRIMLFVAVLFPTTKAFTINGLPAVVTSGQVEILTWTRELNDPTNFQLAKSEAGKVALGMIGSPVTASAEDPRGTLPITFLEAPNQLTIAAYDLNHVQLDVLVDPTKTKPTPFFADTVHPINVQLTPPPLQELTPTSATPSPTITQATLQGTASTASQTNETPITTLNSSQVPTVSASVRINSLSMASGGTVTGKPGAGTGQPGSSGSSQSGMFGNLGYNSTVASATDTSGKAQNANSHKSVIICTNLHQGVKFATVSDFLRILLFPHPPNEF
ncbi:hypothetical protein E1B28_013096 [Marasmius oreades]|uniref:Uncharacterized protein n=1 Tax=Marasmius oreades TaxID=181124 RepID=A0A9P7RPW5_9AGAR|nr:uncharacterized protein E1B28_013096 [Marasmius oreades]KAG7087115.1 hypothetical protein E1B28_013096 [Marasmius oreades]